MRALPLDLDNNFFRSSQFPQFFPVILRPSYPSTPGLAFPRIDPVTLALVKPLSFSSSINFFAHFPPEQVVFDGNNHSF